MKITQHIFRSTMIFLLFSMPIPNAISQNHPLKHQRKAPQKIAFVSSRTGHQEIFLIGTDGKGLQQLTKSKQESYDPQWSPDRKYIAFTRRNGKGANIYVIKSDGTGQRRLTNSPYYDGDNEWLPDGKRIRFMRQESPYQYYTISADGTGLRRAEMIAGVVSPNGKWVAYNRPVSEDEDEHRSEIWLENSITKKRTRITHFNRPCSTVFWSPDSSQFVFYTEQQKASIFRYDTKSKKLRCIVYGHLESVGAIRWSPNGRKVVLCASAEAKSTPTPIPNPIIDETGIRRRPLTFNNADHFDQLYLLNPDGSKLKRLTNYWGGVTLVTLTTAGEIIFGSKLAEDTTGVMYLPQGLHKINPLSLKVHTLLEKQ